MTDDPSDFEKLSEQQPESSWREYWQFLFSGQRWWLIPIVLALVLLGLLAWLGGTGAAPFIYTLF